jgi:hypothetical protein
VNGKNRTPASDIGVIRCVLIREVELNDKGDKGGRPTGSYDEDGEPGCSGGRPDSANGAMMMV